MFVIPPECFLLYLWARVHWSTAQVQPDDFRGARACPLAAKVGWRAKTRQAYPAFEVTKVTCRTRLGTATVGAKGREDWFSYLPGFYGCFLPYFHVT